MYHECCGGKNEMIYVDEKKKNTPSETTMSEGSSTIANT